MSLGAGLASLDGEDALGEAVALALDTALAVALALALGERVVGSMKALEGLEGVRLGEWDLERPTSCCCCF